MICQSGIPYTPGEPLPLQPGDVVFYVSTYDFYAIKEKRIHGVAIYEDRCCVIMDMDVFPIVKDCELSKIEGVFFYTREDAELWKKKHLTEPPFILDECNRWVSPEQFLPRKGRYYRVYVRLQTADGIVETTACYDDGSQYPEDKGFWDGTERHSHKYENVIAWTGSKESEE